MRGRAWLIAIVSGALGCLILLAVVVAGRIERDIGRAAGGVTDVGRSLLKTSDHLLDASQKLKISVSEQVTAGELAAEALAEVQTMANATAEKTVQAEALIENNTKIRRIADGAVLRLAASIQEVASADDQIRRIVKTIDEISFQTRLLALNASVEAARAGESGAGFAVVADEVKKLAVKASTAAKDTESLIEASVAKVQDSAATVIHVRDAFQQLSTGAEQLNRLIKEIAADSAGQAEKIKTINAASVNVQAINRQTAGNSDECAAISLNMQELSEKLKGYVNGLLKLTGDKQFKF